MLDAGADFALREIREYVRAWKFACGFDRCVTARVDHVVDGIRGIRGESLVVPRRRRDSAKGAATNQVRGEAFSPDNGRSRIYHVQLKWSRASVRLLQGVSAM